MLTRPRANVALQLSGALSIAVVRMDNTCEDRLAAACSVDRLLLNLGVRGHTQGEMFASAHRCAWLGLGLLAACRAADERPAEAAMPVRTPYATYELRLCRVTCGPEWPANTIRSGWVVLDSAPIALGPFPDSVRQWLEYSAMSISDGRERTPNGCYLVRADRPEVKTYAGLLIGGLTWGEPSAGGDSVRFSLYGSPDAGYHVAAAFTSGGFEGAGHSWGGGAAEVDYPDDLVLGRRLGPPDPSRCGEAGLAGWATFANWRRAQRQRPSK